METPMAPISAAAFPSCVRRISLNKGKFFTAWQIEIHQAREVIARASPAPDLINRSEDLARFRTKPVGPVEKLAGAVDISLLRCRCSSPATLSSLAGLPGFW